MRLEETTLKDSFLIHPVVHQDSRGYFQETYREAIFKEMGLDYHFVQDNESKSQKGVLRGLHFQTGSHAQAKLVRVIRGAVLDVIVDIRKESPSFGKHYSVLLSEQNKLQLLVPRGFAHGFLVLEDDSIFSYKCDNYYHKEFEGGISYKDPDLKIDWGMPEEALILSEKDKALPTLSQLQL
jgi:dTDP-4-dehydrorhamnose 3,5-epimerase